jgi:hypothetical protein
MNRHCVRGWMMLTTKILQHCMHKLHLLLSAKPKGEFMFKPVLSGLLVISVSAMLVTKANAILCPTGTRQIGGSCVAVPKGVLLDVVAQGQGCHEDNSFASVLTPLPGDSSFSGLVFCSNKPGNIPQGEPVGGFLTSNLEDVDAVAAINDKQECKGQLILNATRTELTMLNSSCRRGQVAVDFVPLEFESDICITDDPFALCTDPIDSLKAVCVHPNPASIQFDRTTQTVVGDAFECDRCPGNDCHPCVTDGDLNGTCPDL